MKKYIVIIQILKNGHASLPTPADFKGDLEGDSNQESQYLGILNIVNDSIIYYT